MTSVNLTEYQVPQPGPRGPARVFSMSKNQDEGNWAEAQRLCGLSDHEVWAAREMGLDPLSLIKDNPGAGDRRKSVAERIQHLYEECYGLPLGWADSLEDDDEEPDADEIGEENLLMKRRQREFRLAAECIAGEFGRLPEVLKVVLFGSVAVPLKKEVPRFRKFRRAGVAIWHECKDVDLAVWISGLDRLKQLQNARSKALNELFAATEIGVAHHQVEVFLMEPRTDRYLGRLCWYGVCPKGKRDCNVPGCGSAKLLKQDAGFKWRASALAPGRTVTLFERGSSPEK